MASTIQIKRGTGSAVPSGLADGELAINLDNRRLYFGSGSTSVNDFSFGEITAEKYIVSSSVLYVTTSFSSGSTEFGNTADDTHTFTGHITASGNISSSGTVTAAAAVLTTADINGGTIDGITSLTAGGNLDIGAHELRASTFESDVSTGTAPFTVASTTEVANLHADTATTLHTARTIGGVSFNGSANIDLPGVTETGDQDKSGNEHRLKTGHYYYTDVTKAHAVRNESDVDRIHLVIDCYSNNALRTLIA